MRLKAGWACMWGTSVFVMAGCSYEEGSVTEVTVTEERTVKTSCMGYRTICLP